MRTQDDWVPTVNNSKIIKFFNNLVRNDWTIVIFSNQLERNPRFTQDALIRLRNFIDAIKDDIPQFDPFVYIAIREDNYRKPDRGMWDLFLEDIKIAPNTASFYCGDAYGPDATNPLYRWADFDRGFAMNCNMDYYTPDEILGVYESSLIVNPIIHKVFLIMAAHSSQYDDYINEIIHDHPEYVVSDLQNTRENLENGNNVIIVGE